MNFPSNIEEKLGFDKIKEWIIGSCTSALGAEEVEKIKFISDSKTINKLCQQTREFCYILQSADNYVPIRHIDSLKNLKKIKVPGSFIESQEIHEIGLFIESLVYNLSFFENKKDQYPFLHQFVKNYTVNGDLPDIFKSKLNKKGEVRDDATPELRKIRREIQTLENKVRKVINAIISQSKKDGITPEDSSITVRNGRLVVPVKAEHKRRFKGFIHDESATGQTAFIEPAEILELNNEVIELTYQEHREIVKILIGLCDKIREDYDSLESSYTLSAKLDFIRAKALLSNKIEAVCPELSAKKTIWFLKARHPVLESSLKKQDRKIVPLDITFEPDKRILVISGPNAGGKSVTLKTLGLMQYMFQCGMLIPVEEGSVTCLFDKIFIDIGDEQSIENDLSTYSSHLKNMAYFVNYADKKTLFLIDEFGTGTDPKFGGAIAESILMELLKLGSFGALSTHYSNLKKIADKTEGLTNARMRFDVSRLEPLFQLEVGKPGSSFALEIAGKIGLPKSVIQQARKNVGYDEVQFDNLLNELEKEKSELMEKLSATKKNNEILERTIQHYQDLKEDLEDKKREILNRAKIEAQSIMNTANQKIESAIFQIKKSNARKEVIKQEKSNVESFQKELKIEKTKPKEDVKILEGPIKEGDLVRIKGSDTVGEVIRLAKKSAEVSLGAIKSNVNLSKLERIKGKPSKSSESGRIKNLNFDINVQKSNFSPELDVRGKRVEEVNRELKEFMDQALLFSYSQLKIIHGKGNGVLRNFIRQELLHYPEVTRMEDEHADRGGSGITIVYLN